MYGVPSRPLARRLRCDQGQLRRRLEKARNGGRPWARKARQSLDHGPCNTAISSSLQGTSAPQHGAPRIRPSNQKAGEDCPSQTPANLLQHLSPMEISHFFVGPLRHKPLETKHLSVMFGSLGGLKERWPPSQPFYSTFNESTRQNSSTRGTWNRRLTVAEWRFHQALILAVQ